MQNSTAIQEKPRLRHTVSFSEDGGDLGAGKFPSRPRSASAPNRSSGVEWQPKKGITFIQVLLEEFEPALT